MKFIKNKLVYGLMGLVLTGCLYAINKKNKSLMEGELSAVSVLLKPFEEPRTKSCAYEPIKAILIRDFTSDFFEMVIPNSPHFQALEKRHGKEGLLEKYVWTRELSLKLGANKNNPSEQDYKNLGQLVAESEDVISQGIGHINNLDEKVVAAFVPLVKLETEHYIRLMKTAERLGLPEPQTKQEIKDYVNKLILSTYSKEEYSKYIKGFNKRVGNLYGAMGNTLGLIEKLIGQGELNRVRDIIEECYKDTIDEYFPD